MVTIKCFKASNQFGQGVLNNCIKKLPFNFYHVTLAFSQNLHIIYVCSEVVNLTSASKIHSFIVDIRRKSRIKSESLLGGRVHDGSYFTCKF